MHNSFSWRHVSGTWGGRLVLALVLAGAIAAGVWAYRVAAPGPAAGPEGGSRQAIELARAEQRGALCTSANAVGVGLRGEYFSEPQWRGQPAMTRVDSPVDFDASFDWPADQGGARPRSVRWSGWIKPPLSGLYQFHAGIKEARISVAKEDVVGGSAGDGHPVELAAGRFYPITVELPEVPQDMSRVRLEWTAPHGARYLIPRTLLFLPTESVSAGQS